MRSNRFHPRSQVKRRSENLREERKTNENSAPKIVFSFKDFDNSQIPPGQSFEQWQKDGVLAYFLEQLTSICQWTIQEAQENGVLSIYKKFPPDSDFKWPQHIASDVQWAVIKKVKGQKGRVAGHVIENVFYVVFFDKDHVFWKTKR